MIFSLSTAPARHRNLASAPYFSMSGFWMIEHRIAIRHAHSVLLVRDQC
jgi:hypothetical protein